MERQERKGVINPEIPETPAEKLALLRLCEDALRNNRTVQGVTPRHIGGTEGLHALKRAQQEGNGITPNDGI